MVTKALLLGAIEDATYARRHELDEDVSVADPWHRARKVGREFLQSGIVDVELQELGLDLCETLDGDTSGD